MWACPKYANLGFKSVPKIEPNGSYSTLACTSAGIFMAHIVSWHKAPTSSNANKSGKQPPLPPKKIEEKKIKVPESHMPLGFPELHSPEDLESTCPRGRSKALCHQNSDRLEPKRTMIRVFSW